MRNKHIYVESDSKLLIEIRKRIKKDLDKNPLLFKTVFSFKVVFYFGAFFFFYFMLFQNISIEYFFLNYILLGITLLLMAFNFAHDFSHNTVFKSKKWNNFGFTLIYCLVGAHAEAWKERHVNSHHFAPNVQEYDSDLQITNLIRVSPEMQYKWFHKFQFLYAPITYTSYSLYWIFIKDFVLFFHKLKSKTLNLKYSFSFIFQKSFYVVYILILPMMFSYQNWRLVFLGFIIMHMVKSIILLFTFFMTHHVMETEYPETDENGMIQTSWMMNQVLSSNDMHPFSYVANFILGGFNNHIAHHLFPNIHHIWYPKLNKILYEILIENGIKPNQTSYVGGMISHMKLLKKFGKE
ncbi:fatty acid desaturase family protein [Aureivirga sp. CE67]|uniref:fatty acid desaturase family protein n=1 Tax=Aureivirga sp. CE67 TaxID=1788983 RepID=UPI0018CA99D3|nr:fatty acid desaturase [Aureivirga sp. CE67]